MLPDLTNDSIINFLTLRYDPTSAALLTPLNEESFAEEKFDNVQLKILEIVKEDLETKITQRKISRISIALSGGIDSGFTLLMAKNYLPELKVDSICVGFGDHDDEVSRAKEISRQYDCDFHEIYIDNVLEDLPKLISISEAPRWNLYQFYSLEKAKKYSDVFFSGDGGDEIFGGYVFRYKKFLDEVKKVDCPSWMDKSKIYLSCHDRDWVPDQEEIFNKRLNFSWDRVYENFKPYFDNVLHPINQVFLADFNGKLLHDWIPSNDKFGRHLNLEIHSLFLNPKMVSFSTKLPWWLKYDSKDDVGKLPLLTIMNAFRGFEDFRGIKKGFSLNLLNMWNRYGKDIVSSYLNTESDTVKDSVANGHWITKAISLASNSLDDNLKIRYISKLLSLFSFELWYRIFISCNLNPNVKL
ncbi:MAG: asparagine synthase [Nitrosopumilus sp.]|nr:asparagine synthase [Nitrosopumilus sp.]